MLYERTCIVCGQKFTAKSARALLCSIECKKIRAKEANHIYYLSNREREIARCIDYNKKHKKQLCDKARERRRNSPKKQQALIMKAKRWYIEHKDYVKGRDLEYRAKNSDMKEAHAIFLKSIRKGLIKKQPCEICGEEKAEAHHDDYNKPLEVRWLCRKHHREWHAYNKPKRKNI